MRIEKEYKKDFNAKPKERNVFIFMDGTWNDENGKQGSGLVTNVVKLFRSMEEDSDAQISRYFRGIGNDDDYGFFGKYICGGTGRDEKRIRDEAYATIAREFHPGDKIHIFGFSRGAASARMLANQVYKEGIPENIKVIWETAANRTTRNIEDRFVRYISSGKKHNIDVEFLGVWDTVGAFGIPININYYVNGSIIVTCPTNSEPLLYCAIHIVSSVVFVEPVPPITVVSRPTPSQAPNDVEPEVHDAALVSINAQV